MLINAIGLLSMLYGGFFVEVALKLIFTDYSHSLTHGLTFFFYQVSKFQKKVFLFHYLLIS